MQVVLTGSSSGIGRALTERLLSNGHRVYGLARSDQSSLAHAHLPAFAFRRCNVADWSKVNTVATEVARDWPQIDALILCAGIVGAVGRTTTIDPASWSESVHANLAGTFFSLRAFWPLLQATKRRAKVICFSGGGATKARPCFSAYGSAKAAMVRLVETIAEEERDTAVDINAIAPGAINTFMTEEVLRLGAGVVGDTEYQAALATQAQGEAPLENVLGLVEWLLSPESDGISGKLISAQWDPWRDFGTMKTSLEGDPCTLRRVPPAPREAL